MCQDPSIFLLPLAQQISALRQKLQAGGFEAYFVGGCVRDACRGVEAQDIDLATDATPEQMKALLPDFKPLETGVRHGTLTFTCGGRSVEMTTYRTENGYTDHRRPDAVTFSSSLEEDLARRDFTVNAMAWSPEHGLTDPFGGREDLQKRVIRCVGQAKVRFAEDALRMLRALRFSSVLGFSLDADTEQALHDRREDLRFVSAERVLAETERLLCGKEAGRVILKYTDVLGVWLPELLAMKGFEQHNPHHCFDVLTHCAKTVEQLPAQPVLRWAGLLHDCGKPQTFSLDEVGVGHFYGHAQAGEKLAEEIFGRLKSSKQLRESVCRLIAGHDVLFFPQRRFVARALGRWGEEDFFRILCLKRADCLAQGTEVSQRCADLEEAERLAREILEEQACFSLRHLAVNGMDLLALGVEKGPNIGALLAKLLDAVQAGEVPNQREELLKLATFCLTGEKANKSVPFA